MPAIPSSSFLSHRRHPSRLPFGSLRSAWTEPGGDAKRLFPLGGNGRLCPGTTPPAGRVQCGWHDEGSRKGEPSHVLCGTVSWPNPRS